MNPEYPEYPKYQQTAISPAAKKYAIISVLIFVLALTVWLVVSRASTTSLTVKTSDPADEITILEKTPSYKVIDTHNAKGSFTVRLPHGSYVVTAKNRYASAQQLVTLSQGSQTVSLTVNSQASVEGSLENVTDRGAYSPIADGSSVRFIDQNHTPAQLYQIDSNNTLTALAPGVSFDLLSWADPSFGVGQSGDKLVAISRTAISGLTIPVGAKTFTVAPNRDVYLSDGKSVYRGASGVNFTKVFTGGSDTTVTVLGASNDTVLLTTKYNGASREGELVTLHKDGSKQEIDGDTYEAVWSKNGSYLALSGDTTGIYNNKLERQSDLPMNNVTALAWLNDDTLAYSDTNLIWQFSVRNHSSSVLATTQNGAGSISQITPSTDGSSLYLTIQNSDTGNGYTFYLARYRFKGSPSTNPMLQKVTVVLPNTVGDGCNAGYVNFTRLTVTVSSTAAKQQDCINATKSYLQEYNVDPNAVPVQFVPGS